MGAESIQGNEPGAVSAAGKVHMFSQAFIGSSEPHLLEGGLVDISHGIASGKTARCHVAVHIYITFMKRRETSLGGPWRLRMETSGFKHNAVVSCQGFRLQKDPVVGFGNMDQDVRGALLAARHEVSNGYGSDTQIGCQSNEIGNLLEVIRGGEVGGIQEAVLCPSGPGESNTTRKTGDAPLFPPYR